MKKLLSTITGRSYKGKVDQINKNQTYNNHREQSNHEFDIYLTILMI
ncbi:hypothetical protein K5X82_09945 [Halosquirtibacter xylanolyticus]|nr:hypothetical protein K5X82_09945 [Prolixibacteraceae bacterium]